MAERVRAEIISRKETDAEKITDDLYIFYFSF